MFKQFKRDASLAALNIFVVSKFLLFLIISLILNVACIRADQGSETVLLWPWEATLLQGEELVVERSKVPGTHDRLIGNVSLPSMVISWPEVPRSSRLPCVLICPGGGYSRLVIDREGHDRARWFNERGMAAAVLKYRLPDGKLPPDGEPLPLQDARRAIQILRARANEWGFDPERIGVAGSSAGGHLAAILGTRLKAPRAESADLIEREASRPDFMILFYPVVTLSRQDLTHAGSRDNLLGQAASEEVRKMYSADQQVSARTPRVFVTHARDDKPVPFANSEIFVEALETFGVPVRFVPLEEGGHGFRLVKDDRWQVELTQWLKEQGLSR